MVDFSPVSATIGGALIGLAAGLLWIVNGRIAGVSNIFGGAVIGLRRDLAWRLLFLAGLPAGAAIGILALPAVFQEMPVNLPQIDIGPLALAGSGLLVGVGTALARGCTSGHGVCGIARLSPRSAVAVLVFIATAAVTVFLARRGT